MDAFLQRGKNLHRRPRTHHHQTFTAQRALRSSCLINFQYAESRSGEKVLFLLGRRVIHKTITYFKTSVQQGKIRYCMTNILKRCVIFG